MSSQLFQLVNVKNDLAHAKVVIAQIFLENAFLFIPFLRQMLFCLTELLLFLFFDHVQVFQLTVHVP